MDKNTERQLGVPVAEATVAEPVEIEEVECAPCAELTGRVTATKLNVREEPVTDAANILGTLNKGAEVLIDEVESTEDFYKVCTEKGLGGFCMKQFIQVD